MIAYSPLLSNHIYLFGQLSENHAIHKINLDGQFSRNSTLISGTNSSIPKLNKNWLIKPDFWVDDTLVVLSLFVDKTWSTFYVLQGSWSTPGIFSSYSINDGSFYY